MYTKPTTGQSSEDLYYDYIQTSNPVSSKSNSSTSPTPYLSPQTATSPAGNPRYQQERNVTAAPNSLPPPPLPPPNKTPRNPVTNQANDSKNAPQVEEELYIAMASDADEEEDAYVEEYISMNQNPAHYNTMDPTEKRSTNTNTPPDSELVMYI